MYNYFFFIKREQSGSVFIRTDQLDGETDWKLRKSMRFTQKIEDENLFTQLDGYIKVQSPSEKIYEFEGVFEQFSTDNPIKESLGLEQTLWASTILANSRIIGYFCLTLIHFVFLFAKIKFY